MQDSLEGLDTDGLGETADEDVIKRKHLLKNGAHLDLVG